MELQTAQRKRTSIKMAIQGPSGNGKTYSALLTAFGLTQDWSKVAVIDTENGSSNLYSSLGGYKVLILSQPYSPERYIEAISTCEAAGIEAIILDSITHEWEYLLEYHGSLPGNGFTNWSKITPRHNDFINKIVHSPVHIIATVRTKQDYVLTDKNGKQVPEKVGLKSIQRDGVEYEFTLVFDLDVRNNAVATKDRTGLFFGRPEHKLSIDTGRQIKEWITSGAEITAKDVSDRIGECKTIKELLAIYYQYPQYQEVLKPDYEARKMKLHPLHVNNTSISTSPVHPNGVH